jgi:hypothetical protein
VRKLLVLFFSYLCVCSVCCVWLCEMRISLSKFFKEWRQRQVEKFEWVAVLWKSGEVLFAVVFPFEKKWPLLIMNDYMESFFTNFDSFTSQTLYNTDLDLFNILSDLPSFPTVCRDVLSSLRTFLVKANDNICLKFFPIKLNSIFQLFSSSLLCCLWSFWRKTLKFWFHDQR